MEYILQNILKLILLNRACQYLTLLLLHNIVLNFTTQTRVY